MPWNVPTASVATIQKSPAHKPTTYRNIEVFDQAITLVREADTRGGDLVLPDATTGKLRC